MRYTAKIRFLDRYIGSCICFFFTLLQTFRRNGKRDGIKRILVIELVEMGASIMAYSSLKYIKERIPDAEIFVLCTESTKEPWMLLDALPPENVFALDNRSTRTLLFSLFKLIRMLSKRKIDMVIDYELFTRISAIVAFLIRAKYRAGFFGYTMGGLYRGNFFDVKCYFNQNMHIAKNLLALTKSALDEKAHYYNWDGPIPNEEIIAPTYRSDPKVKSVVREKLKAITQHAESSLILVAPTVGMMLPMRDYPKEFYVEVIQKLLTKYPKHLIVLVGTKGHMAVTKYVHETVKSDHCVDFAGHTATLSELLELFAMSELLLANDSGNPHFAAMADLRTVALYGPETPFMYGPLGRAVCLFDFFHTSPSITTYNHKNPPSDSNACLRSISPDRIVETVRIVLDGEARFRTINNEIPYLL